MDEGPLNDGYGLLLPVQAAPLYHEEQAPHVAPGDNEAAPILPFPLALHPLLTAMPKPIAHTLERRQAMKGVVDELLAIDHLNPAQSPTEAHLPGFVRELRRTVVGNLVEIRKVLIQERDHRQPRFVPRERALRGIVKSIARHHRFSGGDLNLPPVSDIGELDDIGPEGRFVQCLEALVILRQSQDQAIAAFDHPGGYTPHSTMIVEASALMVKQVELYAQGYLAIPRQRRHAAASMWAEG